MAVTRALLGVGIGLLLAERIGRKHRRAIGIALLAAGALSTIPIGARVVRNRRHARANGAHESEQHAAY